MRTYRLRRTNQSDLKFTGERLASVSTKAARTARWTEIRIYKTDTNRWVTEVVGKSIMDNEFDISKVTVSDTSEELRHSLLRTVDGRTFMSDIALEALDAAAAADPTIESAESV